MGKNRNFIQVRHLNAHNLIGCDKGSKPIRMQNAQKDCGIVNKGCRRNMEGPIRGAEGYGSGT